MVSLLINAFIAGFLGTVVMTITQLIEIFITKRKSSNSPALAFSKIFGIDFDKLPEKSKTTLTYVLHFSYGTGLALVVYVLYLLGLQNTTHLAIAYSIITVVQTWIVIPLVGIGPAFWKWGAMGILKDAFHHIVLAISTVLIFMALIA